MTRLRSLAPVLFSLFFVASAFGQTTQGYLNDLGNTPYGINIPVENGFINVSNGNLHLEFPIAGHPQRGALSLSERLVYDSRIWMFLPFGSNGSYHWWPKNVTPAGGTDSSGGWRLIKGNEIGVISYSLLSSDSSGTCYNYNSDEELNTTNITSEIIWTDPSGTAHPFNATSNYTYDPCQGVSSQSVSSGTAADGSGYSASDDGSGNPLIKDNSGAEVYPQVIDRYGNYFSGNGDLVDDTGRVPVLTTQNGNTTYYDVLAPNGTSNNQGTRVRYTVTTTSINVATDFVPWQYSDVHQWSGTLYPVQSIVLPDGSSYTFGYDGDGELNSVALPTGGIIKYQYINTFDSSNTQNRLLKSRTVGSNPPTTLTTNVVSLCSNYSDGCVERVTVQKPSGDQSVYTLTLKNGAWNTGMTAYTGSATNGGSPLVDVSSVNTYASSCSSNCNGTTYISGAVSTRTVYPTKDKSQTRSTFDPVTGKPISVQEWDYIASGQTFGWTPTRETDYTYTGYDVQQVTVISKGSQAGQTNYGYTTTPAQTTSNIAQHGTQNAGGPYLQTVSHALLGSNPSSVTTTYGMDDTGQVVSTSDPNGNPASTVSYQCANSLPYQAKNPLSQTTQYGYDCNSGAVKSVQDPNDLTNNRAGTTYAYESGAGRPQSVTYPDGGQTSYSYPSATEVDTTVLATPSPSISSQDYLDSFGRKYQHVQTGVSSETSYDANGRVSCTTNPHTSSGAGTDGSTCITAYDGLDRPLTQQQPDNTTLGWSYNGATVTSTEEAGKQWQRTSDAFGHLVKVVEPGNFATTYLYDGLGNLYDVTQFGNAGSDTPRVRFFLHDSLSRLTNECHPEALGPGQNCSTSGPWSTSYSYYPAGNIRTQTDARGVTATLSYDALNRLLDKTYPAGDGTPGQHFRYDQTSGWMGPQYNTIGRLSQASTDQDRRYFGSGSAPACNQPTSATANFNPANGNPTYCQWTDELYSYDAAGRVNRVGTAPPSEAGWSAHATDVAFDLAGNMTSLRYPDGRVVTQGWDGAAHLQNVVFDNWNGQHVGYTYASGFTYTPAGAQAEVTMGNGVYTHTPYNNRQQICQTWLSGQQGFVDRHYMYGDSSQWCSNTPGNNGTVSQILDMKNGNRSQGFSYDSLNSLASFSTGDATMQQSYTYDPFGNFNQSGTLNFQAGLNAKNQWTTGGFSYDQAGNTTVANFGAGQNSYQYNGAGQMFKVNGTDFYTYAASGDRLRQDSSRGWTEYQYFNGQVIAEKTQDGSWSDYIYANGQKIARADSFDQRIHLSGTQCANCGYSTAAWDLPFTQYTIKNGDKVSWRQYQAGTAVGGYSIQFTDGTNTNWNTKDINGQVMNNLTVQNQWVNRTVDLSPYAGKTVSVSWVGVEGQTSPGNWGEYFADLAIASTDGTVAAIYTRQPNIGLSYFGSSGMTNLQGVVERSNTGGDAMAGQYVTTYYHSDQIGSTRMTTSGGGWPSSYDTFYPYGQEPAGTAGLSHFQYAGLERDPDTGLDHATFRQYSIAAGRWMSPDPYDGSMDLGNPQSLNRYNYVGNNPLRYTDPSGLEGGSVSAPACWTAIAQGGTNPIADVGCAVGAFVDYVIISSFFNHPKFHGSTSPRPNAHIWDEHEFTYGANGGGALGLPGHGCDFGACGVGPSSFASGGGGGLEGPVSKYWDTLAAHIEKMMAEPNSPAVRVWNETVRKSAGNILKDASQATKKRSAGALDKWLFKAIGVTGSQLEDFLPSPIIIINPCIANPMGPYCSRGGYNGPG